MRLEAHRPPVLRLPDARALRRRQEDLNNIRVDETYKDQNGDWCCALSVITGPETKHLVFVWDIASGRVERLDDEGPLHPSMFLTVRNLAKDTLRPLVSA